MDEMVSVFEGNIPERFQDYFPDLQHVHLTNFIRTGGTDLVDLATKEFPWYVQPVGDKTIHKDRAELIENIAYGYLAQAGKRGGPNPIELMHIYNWWLVFCAEAIGMVMPDYERKMPYFTWRDPRSWYPPVGWTPASQVPLDGGLLVYNLSLDEACGRYPKFSGVLRGRYERSATGGILGQRQQYGGTNLTIAEYYHSGAWYVRTLDAGEGKGITLLRSEDGDKDHPGVCPIVPMDIYSPTGGKPRPFMADNVSHQAAFARMFSQKLDYYDQTLYPTYFTTPLVDHDLKIGPNAVNVWSTDGGISPKMESSAPANPIDADQMMNFTMGLQRILNRNPESFQGGGPSDSAKAITELRAGVNQTIQGEIWPPLLNGLPKMATAAAKMDLNLWPKEKKAISGEKPTGVKREFRATYIPERDLAGYEECFTIEEGLGLGGYQGTQELLMLRGAEAMSLETLLEQLPYYKNPGDEKKKMQREKLEELLWADFNQKAANGTLDPTIYGAIRQRVQDKGEDLFDVVTELHEQGSLTVPPPPPPGADPAAAGGIPPELAALMGGGGPPDPNALPGPDVLAGAV